MTDAGQAADEGTRGTRMYPEDVAAVAGVQVATITRLQTRSKKNRRLRRVKPGDLPKPAGYQQRVHGPPSPYWWPYQITGWLETKPKGPGRPPKPS